MRTSPRIGLSLFGLAMLGIVGVAEAQTQPGPGAGGWPGSNSTRAAYSSGRAYSSGTAARRSSATAGERVTTARRRPTSYARGAVAGYGSGGYAEDDPFRPYSAQARREVAAVSPTRVTEAPSSPQARPQPHYNYFPGMRAGQHINGNRPRMHAHCTPNRGSVIGATMGRGY